ncbi:DEKNAAC100389 [Brettanomyces naardenensis]|uniref:DEKNAAC100389 n=1 Tax=Brettanomyces naardenensis TaxID=13370 RepID=A0A448YEX1_BRENA|nr:DEKNAAC100389 [Brettanomyces naardenensis]
MAKKGAEKLTATDASEDSKTQEKKDDDVSGNKTIQLGKKAVSTKRSIPTFNSTRTRSRTLPSKAVYEGTGNSLHSKSFQTFESTITPETGEGDATWPGGESDSDDMDSNKSPTWLLTDILHLLGEKDRPAGYLIRRANELVSLLESNELLRRDLVLQSILSKIQNLLLHSNSLVVGCGYRILRCIVNDYKALLSLTKANLQYFLIDSFAKDPKKDVERQESLRIFRRFIDIEGGVQLIDLGLLKGLVSITENSDDPLRVAALETLCEVSILAPMLSFRANGIRSLIQCVLEGSTHMTSTCVLTLIKMLDSPIARQYVLDENLIQSLISPFMDVIHIKVEKLQNLAYVIAAFLKTWPGLVAFAQDGLTPLRQLVNCLTFDISSVRVILIHMFYDIFRIRALPWTSLKDNAQNAGYSVTIPGAMTMTAHQIKANSTTRSTPDKEASTINQYTSLLLDISFRCGLWDRLMQIFEASRDKKLTKKVVFLLSEMSYLQTFLVPRALHTPLNPSFGLNRLLEIAIRRHHKTGILPSGLKQDVLEYERSEIVPSSASKLFEAAGDFSDGGLVTLMTQSNVQLRFQNSAIGLDIKTLILNTHVLDTKAFAKWDWMLIIQLMKAPLRNRKIFDEVVKTTKFYKRLLSFYRPFKYRFSTLRKKKSNQIYVRAGCEIFRNLLSHKEGIKYLSENKLLPQIAECLAQVDPYSGITAEDALFSRTKLESTLSSAFFKFLGVLSEDANGVRMMEQWWIFDMFYHITDRKTGRDDLVRLIIRDTKFNIPGHGRIILKKVAGTDSIPCRLLATRILGELLGKDGAYESFACQALVDQLCDRNSQVCEVAVSALTKYATDSQSVDKLISYRPSLDNLGTEGAQLMQAIFSTPSGFDYLQNQLNFVETEMEAWVETKNKMYVREIESFIAKGLFSFKTTTDMPYHFFGALAKTVEGTRLLDTTETFSSFSTTVNNYAKMIQDGEEMDFYANGSTSDIDNTVLELKSALWAVGHIGASDFGITLLEMSGLASEIHRIAEKSVSLSLKGTCFFILGLIAQTDQGLEILDDLGWVTTKSSLGENLPIVLPRKLDGFFEIESSVVASKVPPESSAKIFEQIMEDDFVPYHPNERVVEHGSPSNTISGLLGSSSYVGTKYSKEYLMMYEVYENLNLILVNQAKAYLNLNKLKKRYPALFEAEPTVLKFIMKILELYRVKGPVRRHLLTEVLNFNKTMEVLLKRERKKIKETAVPPPPMASSSSSLSPTPSRMRGLSQSVSTGSMGGSPDFAIDRTSSPIALVRSDTRDTQDRTTIGNTTFTSIYRNGRHKRATSDDGYSESGRGEQEDEDEEEEEEEEEGEEETDGNSENSEGLDMAGLSDGSRSEIAPT